MRFKPTRGLASAGLLASFLGLSLNAHAFELIEQGTGGTLPDIPGSFTDHNAQMSADGRYVVFGSLSTNLETSGVSYETDFSSGSATYGFLNAEANVFLRDRVTNTTTLISAGIDGRDGNSGSSRGTLSADGRFIAYRSAATNLVAGVSSPMSHVYLHDTATGTTTLVSAAGGIPADGPSSDPLLSPDGTKLVFASSATNLGPATGQTWNTYIYDIATGTLLQEPVLSSVNIESESASSFGATLFATSDQADKIAFSTRDALVASDTDTLPDVYVLDRNTGVMTRASLTHPGNNANLADDPGYGYDSDGQFSADGRYLAFSQEQLWDTPTATGFPQSYILANAFVHDTSSGTTTAIPTAGAGYGPSISLDGTTVAYIWASEIVQPGNTASPGNEPDIELRLFDVASSTGQTILSPAQMLTASADGFDWPALGLSGIFPVPLGTTSLAGNDVLITGASEVIATGDTAITVYVYSPEGAANTLTVNPDSNNVDPLVDTSVSVDLLAHWENLYGMEVTCSADPDILLLTGGSYGTFPGDTLTVTPALDAAGNSWSGAVTLRFPAEPFTGDLTFATLGFTPQLTTGSTEITCTALGTDQAGTSQGVTVTNATVTVDDGIHAVNGFSISGQVTLPFGADSSGIQVTLRLGDRTLTTVTGADGSYSFEDLRDGDFDIVYSAPQYVHECVSVTLAGEAASVPSSQMVAGDLNNNGAIDIGDFTLLASSIRTSQGDAGFNANADLNQDGTINVQDMAIMASNWGFSGCEL